MMQKSAIYRNALWALTDQFCECRTLVHTPNAGGAFGEMMDSIEILQTIREDYENALDREEAQEEDYNL